MVSQTIAQFRHRQTDKDRYKLCCLSYYHCCFFEVPLLCDEEILESNSILDQEDQQWSEGEKEGLRDKDPFAIPEIRVHVKFCQNKLLVFGLL